MQNNNGANTIITGKTADATIALRTRDTTAKLVPRVTTQNSAKLASQPAPTTMPVFPDRSASFADNAGLMTAASASKETAIELKYATTRRFIPEDQYPGAWNGRKLRSCRVP